ncbi:MAG: hypothetical protein KGN39_01745 [Betaproteobacteria bacterium]|nr:hypothetical protein [Betaproteobacteria bacterium]
MNTEYWMDEAATISPETWENLDTIERHAQEVLTTSRVLFLGADDSEGGEAP